MEKRRFGNTDLEVTPICFGAWEIGGHPFFNNCKEDDAVQLVKNAYRLGINFFDTAPVYGFGHSEKILGKAVKDFREKIVVSTKCGLSWKKEELAAIHTDSSKKTILKEIDASLKRLDTDYIDLYLIHWPDKDTKAPIGESVETLENIKESGKIRYYGVCNYDLTQIQEAEKYGRISGLQSHYSLLTHELDEKIIPHLIERKIGFQAYTPLERGVLTDKRFEELQEKDEAAVNWNLNRLNDQKFEKVKKLKELSIRYNVPLATFAIAATLSRPGITATLIGTTNLNHLKEAVEGAKLRINQKDLELVEEII